jgi:hypothetical protein
VWPWCRRGGAERGGPRKNLYRKGPSSRTITGPEVSRMSVAHARGPARENAGGFSSSRTVTRAYRAGISDGRWQRGRVRVHPSLRRQLEHDGGREDLGHRARAEAGVRVGGRLRAQVVHARTAAPDSTTADSHERVGRRRVGSSRAGRGAGGGGRDRDRGRSGDRRGRGRRGEGREGERGGDSGNSTAASTSQGLAPRNLTGQALARPHRATGGAAGADRPRAPTGPAAPVCPLPRGRPTACGRPGRTARPRGPGPGPGRAASARTRRCPGPARRAPRRRTRSRHLCGP